MIVVYLCSVNDDEVGFNVIFVVDIDFVFDWYFN